MSLLDPGFAEQYEIVRTLGRGGAATVYLARDLKHGRLVALKVIHIEVGAALLHDRFLAEIRTTARLAHPHILPLFDSGEINGRLFYTMPYVEGESLRQRLLRDQKLPAAEVLRIASEVGEALEYAHTRSIIHRDVKPENILLSVTGHALVADFGIAYAVDEARNRKNTDPGLVVGTLAYMSPEQAEGVRDLDGRSDMYSLACVVHEALTGERPRPGRTAEIAKPARPLGRTPPDASSTIERAVRRAMATDRGQRFNTLADFIDALRRVARYDVMTLGTMAIKVDGRPMREQSSTREARACLAVLSRAGDRGVTRESIGSLLWAGNFKFSQTRQVRKVLGEIRDLLGDEEAVTGEDHLRLDPAVVDSDVARFETALAEGRPADAAALYRGPFLDGFALPDAPAFTAWARQAAGELAFEYAAAVERLAREAEARSNFNDAVRWWRRLAAGDPLNGRVTLELMKALAASGDREAAIREAEMHAALVEQGVAVPSDQAVVEFAEKLDRDQEEVSTL